MDSSKHKLMQPEEHCYYESVLWSHELSGAVECVLRHARLAKEKGYEHDVDDRIKSLY